MAEKRSNKDRAEGTGEQEVVQEEGEPEVTRDEPEVATDAPEVRTDAPEVRTDEAERGEPPEGERAFGVVAIGASAGGLDSATRLLAAVSPDTGLAFVIVQHLDPNCQSLLAELLSRATSMPVMQAAHNVPLEPDHVYIMPPNTTMIVAGGRLSLEPRPARGLSMPIDLLLRSLALDRRSRAVGIILSGTGTDGSLGIKAIKAEGGITFAESDASAKQSAMPRSAISTGCVDFVLPAEGIGEELAAIGPQLRGAYRQADLEAGIGGSRDLRKILAILRNAKGVDFSLYRSTTIRRRIIRRMLLHKLHTVAEYLKLLREQPGEIDALYQDVLIRVTGKLRQELAVTREHMQSIIEEREAVNEELQSANEEILSSNEELQSINEELETAKEELQSTNEELTPVNEELRTRNLELIQLNNDLNNSLSSVDLPIVMLSTDLRIRRFTPMAERVLNLIPTDVGRPIGNIRPQIEVDDLEARISDVIETMRTFEADVRDRDGRWYSMRIRPYRTVDNKIDGAVLTLIDIDESRRAVEQVEGLHEYAEALVSLVPTPLCVLDGELRVHSVNEGFLRLFRTTAEATRGRALHELGDGRWDLQGLRVLIEAPPRGEVAPREYLVEQDFPEVGRRKFCVRVTRIPRSGRPAELIVLSFEDMSAQPPSGAPQDPS